MTVERPPLSSKGYQIEWLPISDISVVWPSAQRELKESEAAKIAENFDPDVFGLITVARANGHGKHHCIDGQTRVTAVRMLFGDEQKVPCLVTSAANPMQAAEKFLKINTGRTKPCAIDNFRVAVSAGREPEASIRKLLSALGYRVEMSDGEGTVRAVGACISIAKSKGKIELLRDTFVTIRQIWGMDSAATEATIIRGFAEFLSEHGRVVDHDTLVRKVQKKFTPARLIGQAKTARELFRGSTASAISAILLETYNANLRSNRVKEVA